LIIFKGGENNNFIRGVRSLNEYDDDSNESSDDEISIGGSNLEKLLNQRSEEQHLKLLKKIESFLEKKKIIINGFTIKNNEKNIRILKRFIYRKTRDENPQLNSRETMDNILKNDSNELIEIFNNIKNYKELENLDEEILEKQKLNNQNKNNKKNTETKEKEQQNQNNNNNKNIENDKKKNSKKNQKNEDSLESLESEKPKKKKSSKAKKEKSSEAKKEKSSKSKKEKKKSSKKNETDEPTKNKKKNKNFFENSLTTLGISNFYD
jgi:hypothetical protein